VTATTLLGHTGLPVGFTRARHVCAHTDAEQDDRDNRDEGTVRHGHPPSEGLVLRGMLPDRSRLVKVVFEPEATDCPAATGRAATGQASNCH
jgi:hypothetical protein